MGEGRANAASSSSCRRAPRPCNRSDARDVLETYRLKQRGRVLVTGRAWARRSPRARCASSTAPEHLKQFRDGEVLVTDKTDPDWEPIMKKAAAIVTNRGGRTCHAAIVSRELGVPAIVGTERGPPSCTTGRRSDGLVRRRRDRPRLRGPSRLRGRPRRSSKDVGRPRTQHHDERRQSRRGVLGFPSSRTTASASRARSSSSRARSRSIRCALLDYEQHRRRRRCAARSTA